jgi:hypothetical protein
VCFIDTKYAGGVCIKFPRLPVCLQGPIEVRPSRVRPVVQGLLLRVSRHARTHRTRPGRSRHQQIGTATLIVQPLLIHCLSPCCLTCDRVLHRSSEPSQVTAAFIPTTTYTTRSSPASCLTVLP